MSELADYYKSIPPFTRYFITGVFVMSFGMTYQLISPYSMLLDETAYKKLKVWKFVTTFMFAGPFSQSFLFSLIMIYFTLRRAEEYFKNKNADFAVLILFSMVATWFYSYIYGNVMVLHNSFVFSLMYVWCKLQPDLTVSIWGFPVKSANLPWVLLGMSILTGGDPFKDLIGIAAGHTYIYLKMILPISHGYNLLRTPKLLEQYIAKLEAWANGGRPPSNVWGLGAGSSGTRVNPNE